MRRNAPIIVRLYAPDTMAGQRELADRVANVHAMAVQGAIKRLRCPDRDKLRLLDAIIQTAQERAAANNTLQSETRRQINIEDGT